MGVGEHDGRLGSVELGQDEASCLGDRPGAIGLAERVMVETIEHMALLHAAAEIDEEFVLRAMPYDPVRAGNQKLRRDGDRAGVRDHACGVLVKFDKDVRCDRPRDQRIALEGFYARSVMRQEARLDVGIDEEGALQPLPERDALLRERHVEFHAEGRRGQHQRPLTFGA